MKLIAFTVAGYRRFAVASSVKLHGDMVALVGPNEAGKSSLLRALAHLGDAGGFESNERPRRTGLVPELTWHLALEPDDLDLLASIPDTSHLKRLRFKKDDTGSRKWVFEPRNPRRDRELRALAGKELAAMRGLAVLVAADHDEASEFRMSDLEKVIETLAADVDDYSTANLAGVTDLVRRLQEIEPTLFDGELDDQFEERLAHFNAWRTDAVASLEAVLESERAPSPWRRCVDTLRPRLPTVRLFDEEDRRLESRYDLEEVGEDPPRALRHLASLAKLDLVALSSEIASGRIADAATRRNTANRVLAEVFDESWNQQGIAIQLEIQGQILHIQASTPGDSGLSDISERSDGMRWFAAMLAFVHDAEERPILLVDELERHLHYDAQADLISVLSQQQLTSKVIYSTHSIGCLPFDLGTGVRVVEQVDDTTSRLENGFWNKGRAGFSPLLACMGAAAASFTPTRRAVLAEGPADAILLPTLLRQATGVPRLSFQVAPGLSGVAGVAVAGLDEEAGRVAFLVDGDPGGQAVADKLIGGGALATRIVRLNAPSLDVLEIEDLVDPQTYAECANDEIRLWQATTDTFTVGDLDGPLRTKQVAAWCETRGLTPPDKVAVAERILDRSTEVPVFAASCAAYLSSVLREIEQALTS